VRAGTGAGAGVGGDDSGGTGRRPESGFSIRVDQHRPVRSAALELAPAITPCLTLLLCAQTHYPIPKPPILLRPCREGSAAFFCGRKGVHVIDRRYLSMRQAGLLRSGYGGRVWKVCCVPRC